MGVPQGRLPYLKARFRVPQDRGGSPAPGALVGGCGSPELRCLSELQIWGRSFFLFGGALHFCGDLLFGIPTRTSRGLEKYLEPKGM